MKTCPNCGMQSENNGRFCWSCGYDFTQQDSGSGDPAYEHVFPKNTASEGGSTNNDQYHDPFTVDDSNKRGAGYGTDTGPGSGSGHPGYGTGAGSGSGFRQPGYGAGSDRNAGYGAGPDWNNDPNIYNENYGNQNNYYGDQNNYYLTRPMMIAPRNIALCIVLTIITCGIYGIFWMIRLNDEINELSGEPYATSGGMVFLFTLITCGIYGLYWYYKMGQRADRIQGQSGSTAILYLILGIFGLGIINYALMQDVINKEVRAMPM